MQGAGLPVRPRRATHPPPRQDRRGPRLRRRRPRCPLSPSPCRCVPASTALPPLTAKRRGFDGAAVPSMGRAMSAPTASARLGASNRDEAGAPRRFGFGLRVNAGDGGLAVRPVRHRARRLLGGVRVGLRAAGPLRRAVSGSRRRTVLPVPPAAVPVGRGPAGRRWRCGSRIPGRGRVRRGAIPAAVRLVRAGAAARSCSPSPHLLL